MWTSFCLLEPDALSLAFSKGLTDSDGEFIWSQSIGVLRNVRCNAGALKLFLDRGADPNKAVGEGATPLTSAAGAGRLDVVQLLVQKGANVKAPNKFGITPLKAAANAQKDREKIIEVLRKAGAKEYLSLDTAVRHVLLFQR
jgi:ankyrin repeat protein